MKPTAELLKRLSEVGTCIKFGYAYPTKRDICDMLEIMAETLKHIEAIRCTEHTECLDVVEMGMHCAAARKGCG